MYNFHADLNIPITQIPFICADITHKSHSVAEYDDENGESFPVYHPTQLKTGAIRNCEVSASNEGLIYKAYPEYEKYSIYVPMFEIDWMFMGRYAYETHEDIKKYQIKGYIHYGYTMSIVYDGNAKVIDGEFIDWNRDTNEGTIKGTRCDVKLVHRFRCSNCSYYSGQIDGACPGSCPLCPDCGQDTLTCGEEYIKFNCVSDITKTFQFEDMDSYKITIGDVEPPYAIIQDGWWLYWWDDTIPGWTGGGGNPHFFSITVATSDYLWDGQIVAYLDEPPVPPDIPNPPTFFKIKRRSYNIHAWSEGGTALYFSRDQTTDKIHVMLPHYDVGTITVNTYKQIVHDLDTINPQMWCYQKQCFFKISQDWIDGNDPTKQKFRLHIRGDYLIKSFPEHPTTDSTTTDKVVHQSDIYTWNGYSYDANLSSYVDTTMLQLSISKKTDRQLQVNYINPKGQNEIRNYKR